MVHEYKKPYRVGEGNLSSNHRRRRDYVISARKRSGRSQDVNLQVVWSWRYAQCYRRCLEWFHIILVINMQFRVLNTAASASRYRLNYLMNSCFCCWSLSMITSPIFGWFHISGLQTFIQMKLFEKFGCEMSVWLNCQQPQRVHCKTLSARNITFMCDGAFLIT